LVEEPEEMSSFWTYRRRWEDNIKIDLQEVGWGCGTYMSQDWDK